MPAMNDGDQMHANPGDNDAAGAADNPGGGGIFEWQFPHKDHALAWKHYSYNEARWWGNFPPGLEAPEDLLREHPWALGPFAKYPGNPVLAPTPGAWDQGRHDGGVHTGSILVKEGKVY